ncbi:hypothetical protein ACROYT_G008476 [Oculina patagonica]
MAKPHSKENGVDHDSQLLLERQRFPSSSQGSPGISVHREFAYETFELAGLNVSGNSLSLQQAIRENKIEFVRQYSQMEDVNAVNSSGFTALHHAASANQNEVVVMLLESKADINCQGRQLLTALHVAVRYNSFEVVKTLMEYNADPSMKDADGATPLHFAARHGCAETSKLLLSSSQSSVNCPDNSGITPFHLACASGSFELCELFFEHRADIRAQTVEEKSPLHLAALHGNKDIVQLLIKEASLEFDNPTYFIDAPDFEENTALHLACHKGYKEIAELLLSQGADVVDGETHIDRHTPLHLAAAYGHLDVVELLMSHGAPVDCRDELQRTPLHRSAEFDRVYTVKYLLNNGADIEAKDNENQTAFVLAVKRGRTRTAELLLESGADLKSCDASFRNCIHLAVMHEQMETLRMLLERDQGQLINERDKDLQTPLHYAARLGSLKTLQLLMEKKCFVSPKDVFDRTPLHAAAESGHVTCVEQLCISERGHVNDRDERGLTPLHLAARESHRETCTLLLHMGANPIIRDSNRWTALHHCAAGGCVCTTEVLLGHHSTRFMELADQEGNTALHVAAKYGHVRVLELILSRGADITVRNKKKLTCLDVAIECGMEKLAEVLIKNDKWMSFFQYTVDSGASPMENLIQSMPKLAEMVMDRCVTYSDHPRGDPEYSVTFDFRLIADQGDKEDKRRRFFAPATMVEFERESLLMHPLTQALLQWKWSTLGRPLFWLNFLTYFAFVLLVTTFAITERQKQRVLSPSALNATDEDDKIFRHKTTFSTGVPFLIVIFICIHMIKELYQISIQKWRYFTHFTNYIEWSCYITAFFYVVPYLEGRNIFSESMALWPLATIVIFLSYTSLILFLRGFAHFGIYISMFIEVTKSLFKVLVIFIPMIFAFSLAFFLLLKEQAVFNGVFWSFVKTFIMMIGEIDYGSIIVDAKDLYSEENGAPLAPIPEFSATIVCLFCVMVSVLLMNLLVGLAVGDIESIQRNANLRRLAMQVEFVTDIDQRYPRWLRMHFQRSVLVLKPNQKNTLALMHRMKLFLAADISTDRNNSDDVEEDEAGKNNVSLEIAKQQEQIRFLQKTVEDQSRLLQKISHQLEQAARPVDTTGSSVHETTL